ncbi:cytochrome-c peroxidase [Pedobacter sp. N36a]|uniref:cytochrome-c peroxidase n=1 Tax=Pedobacter sp. N36a TaxID=2767996 RepID=UPI001656F9A4|nr:cytochrome c peroxidase [Pedobacter sp. N36a]MBC8984295.1 cytochrome-c peroxidase [Pedobacter sp. N36a]
MRRHSTFLLFDFPGFKAFFFSAILLLVSCKKEVVPEVLNEDGLHDLELARPANFPAVMKQPDNRLTVQGVELGRRLFYDARLSGNNRISCASCHHQGLAFSDGLALSNQGISGKTLDRHAPVLFNLAWANQGLFWDGGAKNLESQAFGPLTSADEMHQDLYELEAELKAIPDYVSRFKQVFNSEIKSADVVKALAQFQRTLISGNSRYDQYIRQEKSALLDAEELLGMNLVKEKCGNCHAGALFTDQIFHNNGLDDHFFEAYEGIYQGHFRVSFDPEDMGKFKTPSLRNVALTAPYMHDGRFKTLEEVLDHYQSAIKISLTTDVSLFQNQGKPGIPMSAIERKAILAFLNILTDHDFINNKAQGQTN